MGKPGVHSRPPKVPEGVVGNQGARGIVKHAGAAAGHFVAAKNKVLVIM